LKPPFFYFLHRETKKHSGFEAIILPYFGHFLWIIVAKNLKNLELSIRWFPNYFKKNSFFFQVAW